MPADLIDGNDAAVVYASVWASIERGRWRGPDAPRGGDVPDRGAHQCRRRHPLPRAEEVAVWQARDPLTRLAAYLQAAGELDPGAVAAMADEAERFAADVREQMNVDPVIDPAALFGDVYTSPTTQLVEQRQMFAAALAEGEGERP